MIKKLHESGGNSDGVADALDAHHTFAEESLETLLDALGIMPAT